METLNKKAINSYDILFAPFGSKISEELPFKCFTVGTLGDFAKALDVADDLPVVVIADNHDLLRAILKYPDLWPHTSASLIGVPSGDYDGLYMQLVSDLDPVSYDVLIDARNPSAEKKVVGSMNKTDRFNSVADKISTREDKFKREAIKRRDESDDDIAVLDPE